MRTTDLKGVSLDPLPAGLNITSELGVDGLRNWSVITARRGKSKLLLLAQNTALDPFEVSNQIADAIDLGTPCAWLEIEMYNCALDGKRNPRVLALADITHQCGDKRGENIPAAAWIIRRGRLEEIDPARVACGGSSCEWDRPLIPPTGCRRSH